MKFSNYMEQRFVRQLMKTDGSGITPDRIEFLEREDYLVVRTYFSNPSLVVEIVHDEEGWACSFALPCGSCGSYDFKAHSLNPAHDFGHPWPLRPKALDVCVGCGESEDEAHLSLYAGELDRRAGESIALISDLLSLRIDPLTATLQAGLIREFLLSSDRVFTACFAAYDVVNNTSSAPGEVYTFSLRNLR